jgi:hypothetical protein
LSARHFQITNAIVTLQNKDGFLSLCAGGGEIHLVGDRAEVGSL